MIRAAVEVKICVRGHHSFQRGPGAAPSKYLLRRYISSPHVELHMAKKSLSAFQPPCVKRRTEPAPSGVIVHVNDVSRHSGCSPRQLQTTCLAGSSATILMR